MPDLKVGDILFQGKFHALMWVGGDKPIVHNANKGEFHGVLQQSLAGAIGIRKKPPSEYFENFSPKVYSVYRCHDASIAEEAARFAIGWATPSGSEEADYALKHEGGFLKTKYSDDRMLYAEYTAKPKEREWTVAAMFRALKAFARYEEALTPKHGSSCSQFAVYCYQAAALRKHIGDLNISQEKLQQIKLAGGFSKLSVKATTGDGGAQQLIEVVEAAAKIFESKQVPSALMTHAKVTFVGSLLEQLNAESSGFKKEGYLVPDNDLKSAKIAPTEHDNWPDARRAAGFPT